MTPISSGGDVPPTRRAARNRIVTLRPASSFNSRALQWLWDPFLPLAKVTTLAGPPGQGKSQLSLWLAARVSRGELMDGVTEPADVVIISAEDDPDDTILPRLCAVGADLDRVLICDVREQETDGSLIDAALALPEDGKRLSDELAKRSVRLLVIDPVSSFLDGAVDSHKNADVRRALLPLKEVAERSRAAVLTITHLTKNLQAGEPLSHVIDSVAFTAVPRSVMLMSADPDDEEGTRGKSKILALAKSNLAPPGQHSQRFELIGTTVITDSGEVAATSFVRQCGRSSIGADDLFIPPDDRSELAAAMDFLRRELRDDWKPTTELHKGAEQAGISERAIKRARRVLCGRARKEIGGKGRWWVGLRSTDPSWDQGGHASGGLSLDPLSPLPQNGDPQGGQGGQEDQGGQEGQEDRQLAIPAQEGQEGQRDETVPASENGHRPEWMPPAGWTPYRTGTDDDSDEAPEAWWER